MDRGESNGEMVGIVFASTAVAKPYDLPGGLSNVATLPSVC